MVFKWCSGRTNHMQLSGFSQDALINVNCQQHFLESQEAFSSLLPSPPFPPASLSFTGEGLGGVGCVWGSLRRY